MRKNAVSTSKTFIRLACAALIVFVALPFAFGSVDASKAPREASDGGGSAVSSTSGQVAEGADAPRDAASKPSNGEEADTSAPQASDSAADTSAPQASDPAADAPAPDAPAPDAPAPPTPSAPTPSASAPSAPSPQQDSSSGAPAADPAPAADADSALDLSLNGLVPASPEALLRAAIPSATPRASFAWTYQSIDAKTCKIIGWNNILPTPAWDGSVVAAVPAFATVDGASKKVTAIQGSGYGTYKNLTCHVDFSAARYLQRIENNTFQESKMSGSLDLPDSLTYLGKQSFQNCPNITSVKLPVNPNFTQIGDYAFLRTYDYAPSLTGTVTIPANVTSIGSQAFGSNKITGLQFASGSKLTTISSMAFQNNQIGGALTFPDSLTSVGSKAFQNNQIAGIKFGTSKVELQDSAFESNHLTDDPLKGGTFTSLGKYCFANNDITNIDFSGDTNTLSSQGLVSGNKNLTTVILSPSWTGIADSLFKDDQRLVNVSYPPGITGAENEDGKPQTRPHLKYVQSLAFQGCTSLQAIDFKDAPFEDEPATYNIAFGNYAFQGCTSLKEVRIGKRTPNLGSSTFRNITVGTGAFQGCTSLKTAVLPPTPVGKDVFYYIRDEAFKDTDLGNYATYPGAEAGVPVGTLPLVGREIKEIGARAYQNANLTNVWLPSALGKVGDNAFSNNHMGNLVLPGNSELDRPGAVGANILSGQTVDGSAYFGDVDAGQADVMVEALHADFGADLSHMTSLSVRQASGPAVLPQNSDWATTGKARFGLSELQAPGSVLNYGVNVYRQWGDAPVSTGDVTVPNIVEGVPFEFQFYNGTDYPPSPDAEWSDTLEQWVAPNAKPKEVLNGVPNFGLVKPGYHTQSGAYDPATNAGWQWVSGMPTGTPAGTPVDPAQEVAVPHTTPAFANRWLANSYSVTFDDNFAHMFDIDNSLGTSDPDNPGSFLPQPNPDFVWGSLPDKTGLAFGTPAALPANNPPSSSAGPQGTGFKMGSYDFVGWATTPDLAEADRHEGSNFFSPGAQISTPDPAPGNGGKVTLYAQWKAKDLTDDPLVNGSIMIPARIQMQQSGAHLWSKSPAPEELPGFPDAASLPLHAVPIWAAQGGPGASWPAGIRYDVYVKRPATGAPLLSLSLSPSDASPRAVDVLAAPDAAPYDPGSDPAAPVSALMQLSPSNDSVASGLFYLRSHDTPWSFAPNESYSGTMTFVLKQVGP